MASCDPNNIPVQAVVAITFGAIGVGKTAYDLAAAAHPRTGYQYTKEGGKHLDEALKIINGPEAQNMSAGDLATHVLESEKLIPIRQRLSQQTKTCLGSFMHRSNAKAFYTSAEQLCEDTTTSSHKANLEKTKRELQRRTPNGERPLPPLLTAYPPSAYRQV